MEVGGAGILGRLGEKVLGWVALVILLLVGWSIYQMPAETKKAILSGLWNMILWVVIAAALPWGAKLFMSRLMEIGENWVGLALVAGLTVVDLVAGLIFIGGLPSGGWTWFAAIGALAVAGTYNYLVAEYLAETAAG